MRMMTTLTKDGIAIMTPLVERGGETKTKQNNDKEF